MKKYLLAIAIGAASLTMCAQSAADLFTSAPQKIFPLLDRNTRLDMVDYFKNGMATPSQNQLDGRSAITEMTPESITVKMTEFISHTTGGAERDKGPHYRLDQHCRHPRAGFRYQILRY